MRLPSQSLTLVLMLVLSVIKRWFLYRHDVLGDAWAMWAFVVSLFLVGALGALYAMSKGRHPLWGLLATPGVIGVVVLWFLPTVTRPTPPDHNSSRFQA